MFSLFVLGLTSISTYYLSDSPPNRLSRISNLTSKSQVPAGDLLLVVKINTLSYSYNSFSLQGFHTICDANRPILILMGDLKSRLEAGWKDYELQ